jgi:hypothetical protein
MKHASGQPLIDFNEARTTMGQPVRRNISHLNMVALGFNICDSRTAIATAFAIAISAAGTFNITYSVLVLTPTLSELL